MRLPRAMPVLAVLALAVTVAACGSGQTGHQGAAAPTKQGTMNEQQASKRAEAIVHEAVDGMSPRPALKRTPLRQLGPCLADEHSSGERVQVRLTYQLTGVPGGAAKKLVRQARDAWVERGYPFQDADADWSQPFPSVSMRTVPDDFWMTALTGVVDRAKGDGLAAISVTSPCFAAAGGGTADGAAGPAAHHPTAVAADERAERRALRHSSRIYDVLRVPHAPAREGEGLATYQEGRDAYAHHAWSTRPLTEAETVQALERAKVHLESTGWTVRHVPAAAGAPVLVARNTADASVARLAPSADGTLRVAVTTPVTTPVTGPDSARA
ncbi:hypothetical protein [Streptomyces sp. PsTaAH-124]|uniref:hypothetical protein n=1 Tax=Streptomyces sp. PsTaAH-124 TaxID=1157638 RepID=UPI0003800DE5|nr:hypothetical protein [Streptomyces sp. PsTaAH-124]